jgi:hypothetical protein
MPPTEPQEIVDRLRLCRTQRKLPADVDAALRDAIAGIERLRVETERGNTKKAANRDKGSANR